jgi:metallopeptidase MepB
MAAATSRTPPEAPPTLAGLTPASILAETAALLARSAALRDQLVATVTPVGAASFANVVRPLIDDANRAAKRLRILSTLLTSVWPNEKVREASRECETLIANAETAALMRVDVAALVAEVFRRQTQEPPQTREELDAQDLYLLKRMHSEFTRSGGALRDEGERARLQAAMAELSQLRVAAQKALTEADDGVWFEVNGLAGVPESIISKLTTRIEALGEEVLVKFSNQQRINVMRHARKESTRRRMYVAQAHRFPENVKRLAKILGLRDEVARLLGFDNHATLKMEEKMACSIVEVEDQLHELRERLEPLGRADTEKLLLLKQKHFATAQDEVEDPSRFYVWDRNYYLNKHKKESLLIDTTELAKYFEARHTLSRILNLFEELFGMLFERIEADAWHEDVIVYAVWDAEDSSFLGYLYVDLFERKGKYRAAHHILIATVRTIFTLLLEIPYSSLSELCRRE